MHSHQDHDDFVCRERLHISRLSGKRHNLRSNIQRISEVREKYVRAGKLTHNDPEFNLLVAVEQLQNYANKHLDVDLMQHGMTNTKGTNKYITHQHCCCE